MTGCVVHVLEWSRVASRFPHCGIDSTSRSLHLVHDSPTHHGSTLLATRHNAIECELGLQSCTTFARMRETDA